MKFYLQVPQLAFDTVFSIPRNVKFYQFKNSRGRLRLIQFQHQLMREDRFAVDCETFNKFHQFSAPILRCRQSLTALLSRTPPISFRLLSCSRENISAEHFKWILMECVKLEQEEPFCCCFLLFLLSPRHQSEPREFMMIDSCSFTLKVVIVSR